MFVESGCGYEERRWFVREEVVVFAYIQNLVECQAFFLGLMHTVLRITLTVQTRL